MSIEKINKIRDKIENKIMEVNRRKGNFLDKKNNEAVKEVAEHIELFVKEHHEAYKKEFNEELQTFKNLKRYNELLNEINRLIEESKNKSSNEEDKWSSHVWGIQERLKEMESLGKEIRKEIKNEKRLSKFLE